MCGRRAAHQAHMALVKRSPTITANLGVGMTRSRGASSTPSWAVLAALALLDPDQHAAADACPAERDVEEEAQRRAGLVHPE
jgi:hypothetical protein